MVFPSGQISRVDVTVFVGIPVFEIGTAGRAKTSLPGQEVPPPSTSPSESKSASSVGPSKYVTVPSIVALPVR